MVTAGVRRGPLVVIGDSMLDIDIEGDASRLSPEAPVPVVDIRRQRRRPGGAGLAALLAARSGQEVILVTALGTDDLGDALMNLLVDHVEVRSLPLEGRTTCKCRIAAREVPMLRIDSGAGRARSPALPPGAVRALESAGAILVSDYGRGLAGLPAVQQALLNQMNAIPVVWDPHPRGSVPVRGCTLVTPNAEEARLYSGADHPAEQGRRLCADWHARAVAVTVGRRGAVLTETEPPRTTPVPLAEFAKQGQSRIDTCGAGDQFAVAATAALHDGADTRAAVQAAVISATQFVLDGGAAAVSTVSGSEAIDLSLGIADLAGTADAFEVADRVRRAGGRLIATGGCFDLLHRGHISLLNQARALGDALVVCLNSDASVRRAKGAGRPVVPQQDRAEVLNALAAVNAVAIFDEKTPASLLARLQPDVWVKGEDYTDRTMPEAEVVQRLGGSVVLLPVVPGYSTTRLVHTARTEHHVSNDISQEVS
ncbi:MAG TPA: PfkB family carbohydrate kinase [Propionibacteriaceae bacterium]|nr:PfkB family carbohydrate kinase [Propionibacteriaceae bacterium]